MSESNQTLEQAATTQGTRLGRFCAATLGDAQVAQRLLVEAFQDAAMLDRPAGMAMESWLLSLARSRCAQVGEAVPSVGEAGDLAKAVAALKPTQREALLAKTVGGFSFAEVAQAFGVETPVIVERASRGLLQLRTTLRLGDPAGCAELATNLAAVAENDGETLEKHRQHLGACDACRDLRHDARQLLAQLAGLAKDFQPGTDFLAKISASTVAPNNEPAAPISKPAAATVPRAPTPSAAPFSFRTRLVLFLGLSAVAVLSAVWLAKRHTGNVAITVSAPSDLKVARIVRAAADGQPGLFRQAMGKDGERPVAADESIPIHTIVRTDERTRAWLRFGDGGQVVLDHGTALRILSKQLELEKGEVMLDAGPQSRWVRVASGSIELMYGRASITVGDEVSFRVVSGQAMVHGQGDTPVAAGQEALLTRSGQIRVASATGLAAQTAWSEEDPEAEAGIAGVGELRARRPGDTRSKEQPLRLANHKVTVRILGPMARTEIDETFQNDGGDTLEGMYRFPLPADAQLERLALEVDGVLQEGSFVDRDRAAAIWRGVIHHATPKAPKPKEEMIWVPGPWRDPALLEWQRGGRFELRIFPIPPRAGRRVIVAYTQAVAPQGEGRRYVYPLPHAANRASEVGHFQLDAKVSGANPAAPVKVRGYDLAVRREEGATVLTLDRGSFLPAGDLVIDYQLPNPGAQLRSFTFQKNPGEPAYAMVAVRPRLPAWTETKPRDHVIVVDSSQSMAGERFTRATHLATTLLAEMDRRDRVWVAACDLDCRWSEPRSYTPSEQTAGMAREFFGGIRPAGSSNLIASLRTAIASAPRDREAGTELRVLYIGDGMSTVGHRTPGALAEQVKRLRDTHPGLVISTVGIGGDADSAALEAMARAGGGQAIAYRPGERLSDVALKVLESSYGIALSNIALTWPAGVREIAPTHLGTLRDGGELVAFARFTGEVKGTLEVRGTVGGQPYVDQYPLSLAPSTAPANAFVPRMWAAATIARLEMESPPIAKATILDLSKTFAVMSRYTSLLVLESPAMMAAFGVEKNQVANDWTGEGELDGEEASGTVAQAEPTVTEAPSAKVASQGRLGVGAGSAGRDMEMAAPAPSMAQAKKATRQVDMLDDMARAEKPSEDKRSMPAPAQLARAARDPWRSGQWMRKVWVKEARVAAWQPRAFNRAVEDAEQALAAAPDSRDRHRALVKLLSRNGDLDRAEKIAEQWLSRDRLDAEALTALADLLARQGDREEALRWLSGIVDLEPDNKALHERLAAAYDRAGDRERACAHRLVLADLSPGNSAAAYAAQSCGDDPGVEPILFRQSDRIRNRQGVSRYQVPRASTHGEVVLDANWDGPANLDVALISPQGTRISWMGGRKSVFADRVNDNRGERLGLGTVSAGTYLIEISRTSTPPAAVAHPIRGRIRLTALGLHQDLPFTLVGRQVVAASLAIERKARLVPSR